MSPALQASKAYVACGRMPRLPYLCFVFIAFWCFEGTDWFPGPCPVARQKESVHVNADPASPICVLCLLCFGVLISIDWYPKPSLPAWQKQSYHVNAVLVRAHPVCV